MNTKDASYLGSNVASIRISWLKGEVGGKAVGSLEQLLIISRDPSPPPYSYMRASEVIQRHDDS